MDATAEGTQPQAARLTLEQQLANIKKNSIHVDWERDGGLLEVVRQVVEMLRADPNRSEVSIDLPANGILRGQTSLHWAVRMEDTAMVADILAAGIVDFNAGDGFLKATAFHYAVQFGNMDIVKVMLAKHLGSGLKLEVNAVDEEGKTALHYAVWFGKSDILKFMVLKHLESGLKLNVNAVDDWGTTALRMAERRAVVNIDNVRELLKCKDMRLSEENQDGRSGEMGIEKALMEHVAVRQYVADFWNDWQVYVDAAFCAGFTSGTWSQPPAGLTLDYGDVQHNIGLVAFWIFKNILIYIATLTVFLAARIVMRPLLKYPWYIVLLTFIGGLVCLISVGLVSWSMWEFSFGRSSGHWQA